MKAAVSAMFTRMILDTVKMWHLYTLTKQGLLIAGMDKILASSQDVHALNTQQAAQLTCIFAGFIA